MRETAQASDCASQFRANKKCQLEFMAWTKSTKIPLVIIN